MSRGALIAGRKNAKEEVRTIRHGDLVHDPTGGLVGLCSCLRAKSIDDPSALTARSRTTLDG